MEGQYRFDFEIDSSGLEECLESSWSQVPEQGWCCDTFDPIEGSSSLHHCLDNSQEDCDYLVLWCDPLNTHSPFSFSFRIRHAYAPSSQNNWQLVLGATFSDGQETVLGEAHFQSGLVLGVNYTGSDDHVKIWHVDKARVETLLSSNLNYQEQVGTDQAPLFRVEGDGAGNLDLYWSPDPQEEDLVWLGSCRTDDVSWGRQLVLRYSYTSSRDQALCLDRLVLEGHYEPDTIAPWVSAVELRNGKVLQLTFSETVVLAAASTFLLHSEALPEGVKPESLREIDQGVVLSFPEAIPNRLPYKLRIGGVADLDGNILKDTLVTVMRNDARWGDLVFNELMADPDPTVRYSEEYLELFKRSQYPAELSEWKLMVNERSYVLDASNIDSMDGGEFILIKGITLPNDGAVLSLYSKDGTLVHAASFGIPWDEPYWKKEGGWSLESPDPDQVCRISVNWEYSSDPLGGTPGKVNSNQTILEDSEAPVLLYAGVGDAGIGVGDAGIDGAGLDDGGTLLLYYSEPLVLPRDIKSAIRLDPGGLIPDSVLLIDPLRQVLQLKFREGFPDWPDYQISLSGIGDCMGNISDDHVLAAGAVSPPTYASVLINEIMYDPEEGRPEYVELFVPGDRILDLQDLALHLVETGGSASHPIPLAPHSRLIGPGQYLVITECTPHLRDAYGLEVSGQWIELEGLPGLNNSSGSIYLSDRAGNVVDLANYSDEMHMELLNESRGVSLERISAKRSGSDPENWHSAASLAAYATPGKENSQSFEQSDSDLLLDVVPEVFSPDNDGYHDLLEIKLTLSGNDWVIRLIITDLQGNRIRVLANNHLSAPSVTYFWDGEGQNGAMQPMGFYVIHARGYRPSTGEQWIRRRAVGLVYR